MKSAPIFRMLLRVFLGSAFIVSGFQKLASPAQNFAAVIEKFQIVQGPAASALAVALPWLEFIGGVLLVLGLWTPAALALLWLMNTVFLGVLVSALSRKLPIEQCGCFGDKLSIPLPVMIALDAGLWLLFLFSFLSRRKPTPSLDSFFERT